MQFYKPNSKNTGSACSFWLSAKDNRFYACLLKQDSWNAAKRTGSFAKNVDNPQKKVVIKFSDIEIGGILDAIDNNRGFSGYHDGASGQFTTSFKFEPYIRDGSQVGFSFMVTKSSKEDSSQKNSFVIGFNYAEARILKEHLTFLLSKSFAHEANTSQRAMSADSDTSTNEEEQTPVANMAPSAKPYQTTGTVVAADIEL
jgi:hypothetical protein